MKKKPQNLYYQVHIKKSIDFSRMPESEILRFETYKFKDFGYLHLYYCYQRDKNKDNPLIWHGFITPDNLKSKLSQTQWAKFCNGKREFIVENYPK